MDCREADDLVRRFIASTLHAGDRDALLDHIRACERCTDRFAFEPHIRRMLREAPPAGVSFDDQIRRHREDTGGAADPG
jgi:hypothetical protein